jgi:hypothetical protein
MLCYVMLTLHSCYVVLRALRCVRIACMCVDVLMYGVVVLYHRIAGALPPSVAQGQSFVNDPSMTNASEVKAHIKLRFNNKSGQPTVVARLYQVTN